LRQRILILQMVAFILDPLAGLLGALGVVAARPSLDRFGRDSLIGPECVERPVHSANFDTSLAPR